MTQSRGRAQFLEPLPGRLLSEPLDYILADHLRQRVLCHLCDRLADAETVDCRLAEEVASHIADDMAIHIRDEEEDLFPALRRRAKPDDDIDKVLGQLFGDHAEDETMARKIVAGLRRCIGKGGGKVPPRLAKTLRNFARHQRRHLALENAVIIPLAKVRLSAKDLETLSGAMAARRGTSPEEISAK